MSKALPEGMHSLQAHIIVEDPQAAIAFYKKAFGAVEGCLLMVPGTDKVLHASVTIGDSMLMLASVFENPTCRSQSPMQLGGTPVTLHLNVENVDETFQKAIDAGAQEIMAPADMFWGDRYGKLRDPFGHEWSVATHVRDVEDIQKAAEAFFSQAVS